MGRLFSLGHYVFKVRGAISSAAEDVLMVGSCPLCGLGLTIFDTACFDSPTACAMSFCQSSTFVNICQHFLQLTCASFRFFEVPAV